MATPKMSKSAAAENRFISYQDIYRSLAEFEVSSSSLASTPSAKANKTLESKKTLNGASSLSDPVRQKMSAEAKVNQQSKIEGRKT